MKVFSIFGQINSWDGKQLSSTKNKAMNSPDISIRDMMYEGTSYIVFRGYELLKLSADKKQENEMPVIRSLIGCKQRITD